MYIDSFKIQIAVTLFLVIIISEYIKSKKLPLFSTKIFYLFLCSIGLNLVFDYATTSALNHIEEVPLFFIHFFYALYYITFMGINMFLYFYINIISKKEKRDLPSIYLLKILPFLFGAILAIVLRADYFFDGSIGYSYGTPVASTIFVCSIYTVMSLYSLYAHSLPVNKSRMISIALILWGVLMTLEVTLLHDSYSGLANVLLLFVLILTQDRGKSLLDDGTSCYNQRTLNYVLTEICQKKKVKYVLFHFHIDAYGELISQNGKTAVDSILKEMTKTLLRYNKKHIYRNTENSFIYLMQDDEEVIELLIPKMEEYLSRFKTIFIHYHIDVIPSNTFKNYEEFHHILNYQNYSYTNPIQNFYRNVDSDVNLAIERKQQIISLLKLAIEHDGFEVYYQPIFNIRENTYHRAEALIRLKDTYTMGYVSPEEFIPLAEREGLIGQIETIVFRNICTFLSDSRVKALKLNSIDVNLSIMQCTNPNVFSEISEFIKASSVDPRMLNFEIKEAVATQSEKYLDSLMKQLKSIGCTFSIDDFGTGFSNMSVLAKNNFNYVKIDKELVWPCFGYDNDEVQRAKLVLKSTIELIGSLGSMVVAEGVESIEQLKLLLSYGVNEIQGYYFAKPMFDRDFIEFLKKQYNGMKLELSK